MRLSDRQNILFHKDKENNKYIVKANSFDETILPSGKYKFHHDSTNGYQIQAYEFQEVDGLNGVHVTANGVMKCSEFIEGEESEA